MRYVQVQLGSLSVYIQCLENGCIVFVKAMQFIACTDNPFVGVQAIVSEDDIYIGADTMVEYGVAYDYKDMPELLAWLQSFNMQIPKFKKT